MTTHSAAATRTSERPLAVDLYPAVPGRRPLTVAVAGRVVRGLLVPLESCLERALARAREGGAGGEVAVAVLRVTALDAEGVGVLFDARRRADEAGVELTLRGGHRPVVREALRASHVRMPFRTPSRGTGPAGPRRSARSTAGTARRVPPRALPAALVAHEGGPRAGQVDRLPEGLGDRFLVYDGPRWFGVYGRSVPLRTHRTEQGVAEVWTHLG